MRKMIVVAAILCAAQTGAFCNTIVLKDGKTVEWKSISDEGDVYEVVTSTGTRMTLNKSDVVSITASKTGAPLTGASFTFDKSRRLETVDLLKNVDLKRDAICGEWKFSSGFYRGKSDQSWSRLQTGYEIAQEEYDLSLTAERVDGAEMIVGLVGGGKQFMVMFANGEGGWSGLFQLDGKDPSLNGTGTREPIFESGKAETVVFKVRKGGVAVQRNGKDFIVWTGDWARASLHRLDRFHVPNKGCIYFGASCGTTVKIIKATVSFPK